MKSILFIALCLTLAVVCRANEEGHECPDMKAIKPKLCNKDDTDDTKMTALLECKKHMDSNEKQEGMMKQLYDKCGTPNEDDIKDYTKVTTTDNKHALMQMCSPKMRECQMDLFKQFKDKHPDNKKPEATEEQKKKWGELMACMKKAVGA